MGYANANHSFVCAAIATNEFCECCQWTCKLGNWIISPNWECQFPSKLDFSLRNIFSITHLSANTPAAADPVTMPAKCDVPTSANKYWFSLHVIDHSSTIVFSYSSYTHRSHLTCRFVGSSRPHSYVWFGPFSFCNSYRTHCSGTKSPDESVVPGTVLCTKGSLYAGCTGSSHSGTKHLCNFCCVHVVRVRS